MYKIILFIVAVIIPKIAMADVLCIGKVAEITKWSESWERSMSFSVVLENGDVTPFVQTGDDEFRSMVLTAYAAQKSINLKWITDNVTSCNGEGSWTHYNKLIGYITT